MAVAVAAEDNMAADRCSISSTPQRSLMRWLLGLFSQGLRRPGHEADYLPVSSAEIYAWTYDSSFPYVVTVWYKDYVMR